MLLRELWGLVSLDGGFIFKWCLIQFVFSGVEFKHVRFSYPSRPEAEILKVCLTQLVCLSSYFCQFTHSCATVHCVFFSPQNGGWWIGWLRLWWYWFSYCLIREWNLSGLLWDSQCFTFVIGLSLWICDLGLVLLKSREICIDLQPRLSILRWPCDKTLISNY